MVKRPVYTALIIASLGASIAVSAQRVDTMTGIFDDTFKTLRITVDGMEMAPPVITLGSDDRITFSFDQLADDISYLRYSLVHCNANWQPSALVEAEYVDGFNIGNIDDREFSRMTTTHYVNYSLTLPNDEVAMTVSGNYLLRVFHENDPDTPVLQARFMVSEATAVVEADVKSVTDIGYNDRYQQVEVMVDVTESGVDDPYNDLMVYVSQNGRYDNEVMVRQPLRAMGKRVYYEHLRPLIFPAGNEYRRMETVSVYYPGMGVEMIEYFDPYYHATLVTDRPRSEGAYVYDSTQHGRYFVREYNSTESDLEADYVVTHFTLDMPPLPAGSQVFLDGDFTNRRFDPESVMAYNPATGLYEKSLLLKQGAYNYQYLVVEPGAKSGTTAIVEGDYYNTANEYLVKVYTRRRGERYDRLIGVTMVYFK